MMRLDSTLLWIYETSFSLLVCVKITAFVFTFISCFQFSSLQLCIHLCQTTSACILTSQCQGSYIKLWLPATWHPSNCISLPSICSQFKMISRCAVFYKTPLSLFLSRSLSSCIRHIHPFLTLSLSVSLLLFLSDSFPLSVWFPKKWHVWWCAFLVTSLTWLCCLCSLCHCFALFFAFSVCFPNRDAAIAAAHACFFCFMSEMPLSSCLPACVCSPLDMAA